MSLEDRHALRIAIDEASQCPLCGEYDRTHLSLCPTRKERSMKFRIVFNTSTNLADPGPNSVDFVDADSMQEAMVKLAAQHPVCSIISARLEGPSLSPTEQVDLLVRALRPLYTVCRALLDNPSAGPLFTPDMRQGLEGMCLDAVNALKAVMP